MKNSVILSLCLLLAGCLSVPYSPSSRFFTLQPIKETSNMELAGSVNLDGAILGVGPVTIPEYLNRPQIVTKNADNTIEFAQFDRWAEQLDTGTARLIAKNLFLLLPKVNVELFPWNSAIPIKYQIIIEVLQLDCRLGGEAAMVSQWSVIDVKNKKALLTKRSEYKKPVTGKNYSAVVQAVSSVCESLSQDIAQGLIQLAVPTP
jgi:uncharacterized protein